MKHQIKPSHHVPRDLVITARDYHFDFADAFAKNRYWHGNNPVTTHFFNALQSTFPEGERFFIDAARDAVKALGEENLDPELRQQVKGFIRQEAAHGREHEVWCQALIDAGYSEIEDQIQQLKQLRLWAREHMHVNLRIAATAGAEHYTASLAHLFLYKRPDLLDAAEPPIKAAFVYHALEEIEHKAVCFDLFTAVSGAYWLRALGLLMSAFDVMRLTRKRHIYLLKRDGLWNWKNRVSAWQFIWSSRGIATQLIPYTLRYLKPDFHPWQTDERNKIHERYGALLSALEAAN